MLANNGYLLSKKKKAWWCTNSQIGWSEVSGYHQGGVNRAHQANEDSDLAILEEGSTQEKWHLPVATQEEA